MTFVSNVSWKTVLWPRLFMKGLCITPLGVVHIHMHAAGVNVSKHWRLLFLSNACSYLFSLLPFITLGRTAVARGLLTLERIPKSGLRMILLLLPCWGTTGAAKSKISHSLAWDGVPQADVSSAVSLPPSTWQEILQLKCYFCLGVFSALKDPAIFI